MRKRFEAAQVMKQGGLSRRELMKLGVLGGAGLWLLGCGSDGGGDIDTGLVMPDGSAPVVDGSLITTVDGATPSCDDDTDINIEGPYYRAGAPVRNVLIDGATPGVKMSLAGTVRGLGTCAALAGATVDLWQADTNALYDSVGFAFRGKTTTDADGNYSFQTVVPGHYLNGAQYRPAHIHVKVSAPGYPLLTTQLYFEGDPYNAIDPWYLPTLLMKPRGAGAGLVGLGFDFVLKPAP